MDSGLGEAASSLRISQVDLQGIADNNRVTRNLATFMENNFKVLFEKASEKVGCIVGVVNPNTAEKRPRFAGFVGDGVVKKRFLGIFRYDVDEVAEYQRQCYDKGMVPWTIYRNQRGASVV